MEKEDGIKENKLTTTSKKWKQPFSWSLTRNSKRKAVVGEGRGQPILSSPGEFFLIVHEMF